MGIGPVSPKVKLDQFGGINVGDHESKIGLGNFTVLENVDRSCAELRTALGAEPYWVSGDMGGITRLHRYRNSAGVKQIMAYDGTSVWVDTDDGAFGSVTSFDANADGSVDFAQYRNTVLIASENKNIKCYNAAGTPTTTIQPSFYPIAFNSAGLDKTAATTGGELENKWYYWRVTFDIEYGGDFLGETNAASYDFQNGNPKYNVAVVDWTGGSGNTNKMSFLRPDDATVEAIPTYVARVNFYRSPPYSTNPIPISGFRLVEDHEYYYIGSVKMDGVGGVRMATATDVIFVDDGSTTPDYQISYGVRWYPIRARYLAMHKGRLWAAHPSIAPNKTGVYEEFPDAIIYSRFFSRKEEPLAFQVAAPKLILDHYTGEGITALGSWKGEVLVACKPNSTHAIAGADSNINEATANVQGVVLSPTIGCIAPRSFINIGDALMWLSNEGPTIFEGKGVQTLNAHQVKPILDAIPAAYRRKAHSVYNSIEREWILYFWHGQALRYNFKTQLWTMDVYPINIGAALEIKDSDGAIRILRALDDDPALIALVDAPLVETANTGFTTSFGGTIDWRAHTGSDDFKMPAETKEITGVLMDGEWYDPITLDFQFIGMDGVGTDTLLSADTLTFDPPTGGQGVVYRPFKVGKALTGNRVKLKMSGLNSIGRSQIASITLYSPKRGEITEARV